MNNWTNVYNNRGVAVITMYDSHGHIIWKKKAQENWKLDQHGYLIGEDGLYYLRLYYESNLVDNNPTIDLNGQWTNDTVSGSLNINKNYNYYMSSSNYHVANGYAQMKITWKNLSSITFLYRSYAESNYDYVMLSKLDAPKWTSNPTYTHANVNVHTKGSLSTTYKTVTYSCSTAEHYIWVCYRKDSSSDTNSDRGFIGVPNNLKSGEIKEKAGELLPSEYIYTGEIEFIDNEYRKKCYKQYILPDGTRTDYILDDYIYGDIILPEDAGNAFYIECCSESGGTFSIYNGSDTRNKTILYMKNSPGVWMNYAIGDTIEINKNDKIYLKSKDNISMATSAFIYKKILVSGLYKIGGNLLSLLNYNNVPSYAFVGLFRDQTNLLEINDPEKLLPATTLADYCYEYMFSGCSSLTNAPALPAKTLKQYCYSAMFSGCSSLTNAPALPATTLIDYCYSYMFSGCSSLTNAPVLPATTLARNCCENMFYECSSLINAPALPATTLKTQCYYGMFRKCSSLVNAPALPAKTLVSRCYELMFDGCSSLVNAPALPATTLALYCYRYMFGRCSSIRNIYCYAVFPSNMENYTASWLLDAADTTDCVFHKNPNWSGPTARSTDTIPSNWQIEDWETYPEI